MQEKTGERKARHVGSVVVY